MEKKSSKCQKKKNKQHKDESEELLLVQGVNLAKAEAAHREEHAQQACTAVAKVQERKQVPCPGCGETLVAANGLIPMFQVHTKRALPEPSAVQILANRTPLDGQCPRGAGGG